MMLFRVWPSTFEGVLKRTLQDLHHCLPPFKLEKVLDDGEKAGTRTEAVREITDGFTRSSRSYLTGCVGAIDGVLLPINPPKAHDPNIKQYWCRKGFPALNVQAICDSKGRFLYASLGQCPGAAHDSYAWAQSRLCRKMRETDEPVAAWMKREGLYLIGDEAYTSSSTMVLPWPGKLHTDSPELAFNEMHSGARMAIECAFGMLCRKWLLLKRPFANIDRSRQCAGFAVTVSVCMRLHNMAIKYGWALDGHTWASDADKHEVHKPENERKDHRDRVQRVHLDAPFLSSANPNLAAAERMRGDEKAAAAESLPAWYEDRELSPRDAQYDAEAHLQQRGRCPPRDKVTEDLKASATDARAEATNVMRAAGVVRSRQVHWAQ